MMMIISSILTVFFIGLSTGGLLVSRKIEPHQSLFIAVGVVYFFCTFTGMILGNKITSFVSSGAMSIFFGLLCLGMIGFLIWKFDPAFGYVKQEPISLSLFCLFFLLLGVELAILDFSIWFSLVSTALFLIGLFLGFMFIYQLTQVQRRPQFFVLIPLVPLLFIGLFKLI